MSVIRHRGLPVPEQAGWFGLKRSVDVARSEREGRRPAPTSRNAAQQQQGTIPRGLAIDPIGQFLILPVDNGCLCFKSPRARNTGIWLEPDVILWKKGAGRRLAAVRGGHYVPAPAGRPHGPRRCGGPEHHGVFFGTGRLVYPRAGLVFCLCAADLRKTL